MATVASDDAIVVPDPRETVAARILRILAKAPLNLMLIVIAVFWLVPTLGLFFTSLMSANDFANFGWWKVISHPHLSTWNNYSNLIHHTSIPQSLWVTVQIAIGGTILPIIIASLTTPETFESVNVSQYRHQTVATTQPAPTPIPPHTREVACLAFFPPSELL